jgi:hypothetical protein
MQIATAHVGQLDALEVIPDAFIGIEIRRIAGQLLQVELPGRSSLEEVLDGLADLLPRSRTTACKKIRLIDQPRRVPQLERMERFTLSGQR